MSISIGQFAERTIVITEDIIEQCARLTGDYNALHVNPDVAKEGPFGKVIAHGVIAEGLISAVIGMDLPGEGTIYLEQDAKFLKPMFIGDEITAHVEIESILKPEKGIVRLITNARNQNGELVVDGYAVVKVDVNNEVS